MAVIAPEILAQYLTVPEGWEEVQSPTPGYRMFRKDTMRAVASLGKGGNHLGKPVMGGVHLSVSSLKPQDADSFEDVAKQFLGNDFTKYAAIGVVEAFVGGFVGHFRKALSGIPCLE